MDADKKNRDWVCKHCGNNNPPEREMSCQNCYRLRNESRPVSVSEPINDKVKDESSPPPSSFQLLLVAGGGPGSAGNSFVLKEGRNILSRIFAGDLKNTIVLENLDQANRISSPHMAIQCNGEKINAIDMGSTNGSLLNNTPMEPEKAHELKEGDKIRLGSITLKVMRR